MNMVMRKPLELYQAVIAGVLMILTIGSIVLTQSNKIQSQQDMINFLIENKNDQRILNTEVNMSLKEINNKTTEILIELQNKQDKPR